MSANSKLGLVLSGGGAKGAYEAGVVNALAKLGIEPAVITGASIGAVNGSVIASSDDMKAAAEALDLIWSGLDASSVIKPDLPVKRLAVLVGMNLLLKSCFSLNPEARLISLLDIPVFNNFFSPKDKQVIGILDQSPLEEILKETVNFEGLSKEGGREFYVAVFPAGQKRKGPQLFSSILKYITSSGKSDFYRINDFPQEEAINLILASAAVPLAFKPVKIGDEWFYDGGMGDRVKAQGNTPFSPIVQSGCTHAIVVMLGNGALWDRYEWPDVTILEIRPSIDMGEFESMFNFNPERIRELMTIGERDALNQLGRISDAINSINTVKNASQQLTSKLEKLKQKSVEYDDAMSNIDSILSDYSVDSED